MNYPKTYPTSSFRCPHILGSGRFRHHVGWWNWNPRSFFADVIRPRPTAPWQSTSNPYHRRYKEDPVEPPELDELGKIDQISQDLGPKWEVPEHFVLTNSGIWSIPNCPETKMDNLTQKIWRYDSLYIYIKETILLKRLSALVNENVDCGDGSGGSNPTPNSQEGKVRGVGRCTRYVSRDLLDQPTGKVWSARSIYDHLWSFMQKILLQTFSCRCTIHYNQTWLAGKFPI